MALILFVNVYVLPIFCKSVNDTLIEYSLNYERALMLKLVAESLTLAAFFIVIYGLLVLAPVIEQGIIAAK